MNLQGSQVTLHVVWGLVVDPMFCTKQSLSLHVVEDQLLAYISHKIALPEAPPFGSVQRVDKYCALNPVLGPQSFFD